jgi:hypothetical protein
MPRLHLFVCVNERDPNDPLGPGCRGGETYAALKAEVARRGEVASVWVTRTYCLGVCPREGCTVAVYPRGQTVRIRTIEDATRLLSPDPDDDGLEDVERLQNPHDFPELDDPDWHYEDGVLTGIQAARAALRAR